MNADLLERYFNTGFRKTFVIGHYATCKVLERTAECHAVFHHFMKSILADELFQFA